MCKGLANLVGKVCLRFRISCLIVSCGPLSHLCYVLCIFLFLFSYYFNIYILFSFFRIYLYSYRKISVKVTFVSCVDDEICSLNYLDDSIEEWFYLFWFDTVQEEPFDSILIYVQYAELGANICAIFIVQCNNQVSFS